MDKILTVKVTVSFENTPSQVVEPKQLLVPATSIGALIPEGNSVYSVAVIGDAIQKLYPFIKIKAIKAMLTANEIQTLGG